MDRKVDLLWGEEGRLQLSPTRLDFQLRNILQNPEFLKQMSARLCNLDTLSGLHGLGEFP